MAYDKNTKLITLDKVVIGGEEFTVTTRDKEMLKQIEGESKKRLEYYLSLPHINLTPYYKQHHLLW